MLTYSSVLKNIDCTENDVSLIVPSFTINNRVFIFLRSVSSSLGEYGLGTVTILSEYGHEVFLDEDWDSENENTTCKLSISKNRTHSIYFFTSTLKKKFKEESKLPPVIKVVFECENFENDLVKVVGRKGILEKRTYIVQESTSESLAPKYVVSLNQAAIRFLPQNIAQWFTSFDLFVPDYWKIISTPKLLATLGTEIFLERSLLEITFRGERRVRIPIDVSNETLLISANKIVSEACRWIYLEGKDIETRHSLFVSTRLTPSLLTPKSMVSLLNEESSTNAPSGATMERKWIDTKSLLRKDRSKANHFC